MNKKLLGIAISTVITVVLTVVYALRIYELTFDDVESERALLLPDAQWEVLTESGLMFFLANGMFVLGWSKRLYSVEGWKGYLLAGLYFLLCVGFSFMLFMLTAPA